MTISKRFTLIILLLAACLTLTAQRATTATYQLGLGTTDVLDTYLSQEKFQGAALTLLATRESSRPDSRWATLLEHELNIASVDDRAEKRTELQGEYSLFAGRLYAWRWQRLQVQAGAVAALNAGFIYNVSNSNNPAQARFALQAMPTAVAAYSLPLFGRQLRLRYELQLPLVGLMFSPNYGQSYYEIFSLGNYDHNIVPTTFVATPNLRHQLSAEYPLSPATSITVGYLGHYEQSEVNNLKTHLYHHRLLVGIVRRFTLIPARP